MRNKTVNTLIIVLLLFVGTVTALRAYYRLPVGDELIYQYVWEKDDPTWLWDPHHRFERKISSFQDVLQTQKTHYFEVNGRALVHTLEQSFTGHELLFSIVNALVFILLLTLIVRYTNGKQHGYFTWIVTACVLLWLFPLRESLWVSINYAPNYLWSAMFGVLVLWLLKLITAGTKVNKFILVIVGLIFGWSHEGFVITIAGGIFIYYCFNFKLWKGLIRWLTIPMWFSSLFLIFSPGNLNRYFFAPVSEQSRLLNSILSAIDNYSYLWLMNILLFIGIVLLLCGKKRKVWQFIKQNSLLFIILITGLLFQLFAHTETHSHTPTELICTLILIKSISSITISRKYRIPLDVILTSALCVWGLLVVKDTRNNFKLQQRILAQYLSTTDGFVEIPPSPTSWLTRKFVRTWDRYHYSFQFPVPSFESVYFQGDKTLYLLNPADYQAVHNPSTIFTTENQLWKNIPVYRVPGGIVMWIDSKGLSKGEQLEATLKPASWLDEEVPFPVRLKFLLMPSDLPSTAKIHIDKFPIPYSSDSISWVSEKELGLRHIESIHKK